MCIRATAQAGVLIAAVLLAAVGAACRGGGEGESDGPARPGWLVFYSYTAFDQADIFRIDADGQRLTNLTEHPGTDVTPVVSPDGSRIAFASSRNEEPGIYVMNADGSGVFRVTDYPEGEELLPRWSPDGDSLLFGTDHDRLDRGTCCSSGVFRVGSDGTDFTLLAEDAHSPDWSPTGDKIAFVCLRPDGGSDICIMHPDGTGLERLTDDPGPDTSPSWSPAGERLAFTSTSEQGQRISVLDADGQRTELTGDDGELSQRLQIYDPWSPDGQQLVFVMWSAGRAEVWTVAARGGDLQRVAADAHSPRWSPDGQALAVTRTETEGDSTTQNIYLVSLDGQEQQLTDGHRFRFIEGRLTLIDEPTARRPLGMNLLGHWAGAN